MLTNTSATLFNRYDNRSAGRTEFRKVYLPSVFWEVRKGANILTSGLREADALSAYIPEGVKTGKTYVDPLNYAKLKPSEVSQYWTLSEGEDYITRGNAGNAILDEDGMKHLKKSRHETFKITVVDPKMYGTRALMHWEVGGK